VMIDYAAGCSFSPRLTAWLGEEPARPVPRAWVWVVRVPWGTRELHPVRVEIPGGCGCTAVPAIQLAGKLRHA
jgi:hypothetical protein